MHEIIKFLTGACARQGAFAYYTIGDGLIMSSKDGMHAGIATDTSFTAAIPAAELEAVLARIQTVQSLAFDADVLTIKSGRIKARIKCVVVNLAPIPTLPTTWVPAPRLLANALGMAIPFVGRNGWQAAIRLSTSHVTAISNAAAIDIDVPDLLLDTPLALPKESAEFIVSQGSPDEYSFDTGSITFRWSDGRWFKTQLLAKGFSNVVDEIFKNAGTDMPCEITEEWRAAFTDAAALATEIVELTPDGFHTVKGVAVSDIQIATGGLDADHKSKWFTEWLTKIVAIASHWNPNVYPGTAPFKGEGFRGVVVGAK